jgi:hypothetical protein
MPRSAIETGISVLVALVALAAFAGCDAHSAEEHAATATPLERQDEFHEDMKLVERYDQGLADTVEYLSENREVIPNPKGLSEMSAADKDELRDIHGAVLDRMRALDQVKTFWKGSARVNPLTDKQAHARAYLAGFAASLTQYRWGLEYVAMTVPNKPLETVLDEVSPRHDLPAKSFADLKYQVIHVREVSRLFAGYQYYRRIRDDLIASNCTADEQCHFAMELVETHYIAARMQLEDGGLLDFSYNAWDIARDTSFKAWFPVQTKAAQWMGDTRVRRKHSHLISEEQLAEMRDELEPGDIVVTRSNWYVSNVGLPGFWPHSELYVGSPDELEAHFDQPQINAHFQEHSGHDGLVAYLKAEHPDAWRAYARRGGDGKPHRILEARSEGVVFNSIFEAASVDYAAALRPQATPLAAAQAIASAFSHWGKPYDFNFDFLTDRKLVCTELVYKAWQPADNKEGVDFELDYVMGRTTLGVNSIVRQFDEEYDAEDRPLEFVYFLDGREASETAVVADIDEFRKSWKRPKWDFAQK